MKLQNLFHGYELSVVADIMSILYFTITALYSPIKAVKYEAILFGCGIGTMSDTQWVAAGSW